MADYSLYNNKWIQGDYQADVVAYYFREWQDHHMQMHCHNQVEIMYAIHGRCIIKSTSECFSLEKGE